MTRAVTAMVFEEYSRIFRNGVGQSIKI
jgi:hypothetical protein